MLPEQLAQRVRGLRAEQPATLDLERILLERDGRDWNRGRYQSQREHWLCWLEEKAAERSAKIVYNRINCPPMLLWLGESSGVKKETISRAKEAALSSARNFGSQSAAIRKVIPWDAIEVELVRHVAR